jgi:hypothetical protein
MRALLATLVALSGVLAVTSTADAARKYRRAPGPPYYYAPPNNYYAPPAISERQVCEERAFAADPSGQYAGYPCWAREAFGRGSSGRGR